MKSLYEYITEAIDRIDPTILRKEYQQAQFPRGWKAPNTPEATELPLSNKKIILSIAQDIFGARYGNLRECGKMPEYNMFNAMHVKQMVFKTAIEETLVKNHIVVPVASYTADTDLGPQMIYYLTESGEKLLQQAIMPK